MILAGDLSKLNISVIPGHTAAQSPSNRLSVPLPRRRGPIEICEYHFNSCCQHQITYFISRPVERRDSTAPAFASAVRLFPKDSLASRLTALITAGCLIVSL